MIVHIPVVEILHLVMKLRNNPVFLNVSRVLVLSLIAFSAIGHAGEWSKGFEPSALACTLPKWGCYSGHPLTLPEAITELGMPKWLLILPIFDLFLTFLLLVQPVRTSLTTLILSFIAFFVQIFGSNPVPNTNVLSGSGFWLSLVALLLLFFLNMPLAFAEELSLHPDWNYWKYLPGYMTS